MNKVLDMKAAQKGMLDKRKDDVLETLKNLNTLPGFSQEELDEHVNATLEFVRAKIYELYESQYDEDEPNVARHNTVELLKDLEAVAVGANVDR